MKPTDPTYGYQELQKLYQRYMSWALSIAVSIQLTTACLYRVFDRPKLPDTKIPPRDTLIIDVPYTPPLNDPIEDPDMTITEEPKQLTDGNPDPVRDSDADTNKVFASQDELSRRADELAARLSNINQATTLIMMPPEPKDPPPFLPIEIDPRPIETPKPQYPEVLLRTGIEGTVFLNLLVTEQGTVKKVKLMKTDADLFVQPATEAAMQWVFTPAKMNGKPVSVWVAVPFSFRIKH